MAGIYGNIVLNESSGYISKEFNKLAEFIKSKKEIYDCCTINNSSIVLHIELVAKQTGESLRDSFDTFNEYNNKILNFINSLKSDSVKVYDNFEGDWDSDIKYSFKSEKDNPSYLLSRDIIKDIENTLSTKAGTLITGVSYTYQNYKTSKNQILKDFKNGNECAICRFIMSKKNMEGKYNKILNDVSKKYPDFELRFEKEESKNNYYNQRNGFDLVLYAKCKSFKQNEISVTTITIKDL